MSPMLRFFIMLRLVRERKASCGARGKRKGGRVRKRCLFGLWADAPGRSQRSSAIPLPELEAIVVRANGEAHPFGPGVKAWMAQNSPDEKGRFLRDDIQPDQTVGGMTQTALEEVLIA